MMQPTARGRRRSSRGFRTPKDSSWRVRTTYCRPKTPVAWPRRSPPSSPGIRSALPAAADRRSDLASAVARLEPLVATEPEQHTGELEQPQVVLRLLVPADQDGSTLGEPRQRAFYYPPARPVGPWVGWALVTDERDVRIVVVVDAGAPTMLVVVALVEAQVLPPTFLDRRPLQDDSLDGLLQELGVRDVGAGHDHRERATVGLDQDGALHAGLGAVGRVRANKVPPILALPIDVSAACHSQSHPPRSSHASWTTAQMRSKIPRPTQRWNVRWTELSSGYSFGRRFHWQPLRSRKMTASSAARWSIRFGPRFGGSCSSRIGSIIAHISSAASHSADRGPRSFVGLPMRTPPIQGSADLMPV